MADEKIQVTIEGNPQGGIDMLTAFEKKAVETKDKVESSGLDKVMDGFNKGLAGGVLGFSTLAGAGLFAGQKIAEGIQKITNSIPDAIARTNELAAAYQMMAITAGMDTEKFNKFNMALQMSGGETENMLPLIRGYARAMRTRADVLIQNGIAQDKASLAAMTFEQYIKKVVDVMDTYGSQLDKDLLLQAAFERSGIANAAVLKNLARNFEEAGNMAKRNGVDMDEASKNLNTYRVATAELGTALDKIKAAIGSWVIPPTSDFMQFLAKIIEAEGKLAKLASRIPGFGAAGLVVAGKDALDKHNKKKAQKDAENDPNSDYNLNSADMAGGLIPGLPGIGKFDDKKEPREVSNDPFKAEADRLAQQEIRLRLKNTMAAEEKAELDAAEIQYRLDRDKLDDMMANQDKEMNRKESGMTPEIHHERYLEYVENWRTTQTQAEQAKAAIIEKFRQKRLDEEKKFEDELSVKGTDGLAQRYAKNQEWADKELKFIREHYEGEKRAQAEAMVAATKAAADKHDFAEQQKKDLTELNLLLKQANERSPMSQGETKAFIADYAAKGDDSQKGAAKEKSAELHLDGTAGEGALAGMKKFRAETENIYLSMQNLTHNLATTMSSGIGKAFTDMIVNGKKFGDVMKALWKDVASSVIGGLIQIATRQALNWALEGTIFAEKKAQAAAEIGVKTTTVSTGIALDAAATTSSVTASIAQTAPAEMSMAAKIYSWFASMGPWGLLAAAGTVAAAMAAIGAIGKITAHAEGGLIDRPTMALMGEAGPEIVAPQRNFMDWAQANQNLGYNLASHNASISGLQHQGNSYGKAGMAASGGSVGGAHVDLRGAVIAGESVDSARIIGNLVKKHMDGYNRRNG